jgi:hypothetical protein
VPPHREGVVIPGGGAHLARGPGSDRRELAAHPCVFVTLTAPSFRPRCTPAGCAARPSCPADPAATPKPAAARMAGTSPARLGVLAANVVQLHHMTPFGIVCRMSGIWTLLYLTAVQRNANSKNAWS